MKVETITSFKLGYFRWLISNVELLQIELDWGKLGVGQVDEHILKLEEISEFASKEYGLERSLENMEKDWQPLVFEVINFFLSSQRQDQIQS
jgi:hypothetical protein